MATLGGIYLGNGLYWEVKLGRSGVEGQMVRSRDGTPIVWEQLSGLRDIDLAGGGSAGTLTGAVLKALNDLASVPGGIYTLIHNGVEHTVRFRTWDQPVIEAAPIAPREDMNESDIYNNIVIKLQEA
jgi:hypothetical protein